jgi:phage shock protein A
MTLEGETRRSSDDALFQRIADLETETNALRDQLNDQDRHILALEDRMQELEARLKRYESYQFTLLIQCR